MCKSGIRVNNICYDSSCGRTGQRPGGRNCATLPGGANACCMTRIDRFCTGPNMDRCRIRAGTGMGMGMMGMGKMGMGDVNDEAEAVGDPHLVTTAGEKSDLCCEDGECHACPPALLQEEESVVDDQNPANMCRSGIRVNNVCYDNSCGRTGQRPGGRNCAALPGGANACCMTRIDRFCTGPNMERCRIRVGMGMGMGMGMMGMMGMGEINDEAEAVGDPHLTKLDGEKSDLCC